MSPPHTATAMVLISSPLLTPTGLLESQLGHHTQPCASPRSRNMLPRPGICRWETVSRIEACSLRVWAPGPFTVLTDKKP